ncbi:MAG: hypothetical protein J6V06_04775 [Clostridia bacterium]|nr:hypothetical protein [Clostridia bacterium]MBO7319316.1 hypothetical protein [Clostridia bacterium]
MTSNIYEVRSAVKKIAWGFFLLHMSVHLGPVDILPDWAGYALIVSALAFVVCLEEDLKRLRTVGIALLVWNVISWIGNIFGFSAYLSYVGIIPAIGSMYFFYKLFCELADLSDKYSCRQGSSLRFWGVANATLSVVTTAVVYLSLLFSIEDILIVVSATTLALSLFAMLGSMITLFSFAGALKDVPDNNFPENYIADDVNHFGDGSVL